MTQPGWYPTPDGGNRYWDGQQWTEQYVEPRRTKGLPAWALVLWFVLCLLGAIGCWWFVLLMVTFGCDSGWEGCETVGMSVVFLYAGLAGGGLLALLLWSLFKPTPTVRIVAFLLMPVWVLLSVLLCFAAYWAMAANSI